MEEERFSKLLKESESFSCLSCIYHLSLNEGNIGVQHYLVDRLHKYPYSELEFFIPQMIQLVVSYETDSMALRDFILQYSSQYPHFCLLAFWNLQAYVFELKNAPDSYSFHTVRQFVNSLQHIMFDQNTTKDDKSMRENLQPALIMCASILSSISYPKINEYTKPLIVSQGKQEKSLLFRLANFHKSLTRNLTLKNSAGAGRSRGGRLEDSGDEQDEVERVHSRFSESIIVTDSSLRRNSSGLSSDIDRDYNSDYSYDHNGIMPKSLRKKPILSKHNTMNTSSRSTQTRLSSISGGEKLTSHSMPELIRHSMESSIDVITPTLSNSSSISTTSEKRSCDALHKATLSSSSKFLQVNYFKKETEFMMILQNISSRLSQVPKEARLSTLRAELSIINSTLLPSQVDIPQLLPISSLPNKRYHRILKLSVNEACVLNSAERVPYLLLIEYLSEDMDFDPSTEDNRSFLDRSEKLKSSPRSSYFSKFSDPQDQNSSTDCDAQEQNSSMDETDLGEVSVVALSNEQARFSNSFRANMSEGMEESPGTDTHRRGIPLENKFDIHESSVNVVKASAKSKVSTKDISAQVRIAALMLRQLEKSGHSNSPQSGAIRDRILKSMKTLQDQFESIDYQQIKEIRAINDPNQDAGERKLENDFKIGEDWSTKKARIRKTSRFGHLPNWDLCSVIVKNGDDLQQEAFACQLITAMSSVWKSHQVGVWTKAMKIVVTSYNSGLVETINNALSVHSIKKTMTELSIKCGDNPKGIVASLKDYFLKVYGQEGSAKYVRAQENFARSLAAYSIICYLLQIKDRHNGNIMLDSEGHIIHIDFGFLLSNSPGSVGFEAAPFKLTMEYVEVLGGLDSKFYELFKTLCKAAFLAIRKESDQIVQLVEMMLKDSSLPCFKNGPQTSVLLKQRFHLDLSDEECGAYVENYLIGRSIGSMYTRLYDQFQLLTQGIYS